MKPAKLIEQAYKSAHYASELTSQLYDASQEGKDLDLETVATLLEQACALSASAQALEHLARGHQAPKMTP